MSQSAPKKGKVLLLKSFCPDDKMPEILSKLKDSGKNMVRILFYDGYSKEICCTHFLLEEDIMAVLKTENLTKQYGQKETAVLALENANISVERGEFVAIIGTSGSGKSTLLHMLGGLDRPTAGKVYIDDKDIFSMKDEELTIFRRRKIGFVFQAFNLIPTLNVYENIVFPIQLDANNVDEAFVANVIDILGLKGLVDRLPGHLSGGQQQRVAIARALSTKPAIILADEPTGNLDSKTSADVLSLLKVTGQRFHQTIVMITHNEAIAQMADRVIRIEDGHIVKGGEASHE